MSPTIEISQETFRRLQKHAVPLVDSIESVINRLMDLGESAASGGTVDVGAYKQAVREFNPNTAPDLTHAKILGVTFGDLKLGHGQDNWNGLLREAVRHARSSAKTDADFKALMVINYVNGEKNDDGYRPLADTGISVQGQDANGAWRAVCHIAQKLGLPLSVKFAWREKPGAAFPGSTGQMIINAA